MTSNESRLRRMRKQFTVAGSPDLDICLEERARDSGMNDTIKAWPGLRRVEEI